MPVMDQTQNQAQGNPQLDEESEEEQTLSALTTISRFLAHHQVVLGATFSAACLLVALFVGIGRFEANAQAQEKAIQDLQHSQTLNSSEHAELSREIANRDLQLRSEVLQRLDAIITKQDLLGSRIDTMNDRMRDMQIGQGHK